jgi:hypothetical protein
MRSFEMKEPRQPGSPIADLSKIEQAILLKPYILVAGAAK